LSIRRISLYRDYGATAMTIKIEKDGHSGLPYYALVDGEWLRKKDGTGRRFKTEKAARKAAEKAAGR
jgi:hypothetical protein